MLEHLLRRKKVPGPNVGDPAPDFTLPALEGGAFTLSEALKKGLQVIAFFKADCGTCQFTFPFLERLHRAYEHDEVEFRGVSQDDVKQSQTFRERFGVTFPVVLDHESYAASKQYHFATVPTILLVDRDARIRFRLSGFSKAGLIQLSEEIGRILSRSPEAVFLPNESVPELKPG